MKELDLRKWHRNLGIFLALLILIQAGSGLVMTLAEESSHAHADSESEPLGEEEGAEPAWLEFLEGIHTEGGTVGYAYRLLVGLGLMVVAVTGIWIFVKIQVRQRAAGRR
ncbi:MAG: hypothetical protein AB1640_13575 [bacterium]